jgi:hypothetical protein
LLVAQGFTPPVNGLPSAVGLPKLEKGLPPLGELPLPNGFSSSLKLPTAVAKELIKVSGVTPSMFSKAPKGDCRSKELISSVEALLLPSFIESAIRTKPPIFWMKILLYLEH